MQPLRADHVSDIFSPVGQRHHIRTPSPCEGSLSVSFLGKSHNITCFSIDLLSGEKCFFKKWKSFNSIIFLSLYVCCYDRVLGLHSVLV